MLDLVLGGNGWALGKMANLVGDKSTGKTLLAIEACANMAQIIPAKHIRYAEAEAAFDEIYARSVGCPDGILHTEPGQIATVEDFYEDLHGFLDTLPGGTPSMYVLDSLDSLSSKAELEKDFDAGSYGDGKAKMLSKMFRMTIQKLEQKNCLLLIISQIRDKLNVTFGERYTRSGGHALDFYASQIVWLAQVQKLTSKPRGIVRSYGVVIRAQNKKCKVGIPYRDAELELLFNYGIDDEISMLNWLEEVKEPLNFDGESYTYKEMAKIIRDMRADQDRPGLIEVSNTLRDLVRKVWFEIEDKLKMPISKYGA